MKDFDSDEFRLLYNFVSHPTEMSGIVSRFLITDETFADTRYAEIFRLFQAEKKPTSTSLFKIMASKLGLSENDRNRLYDDYAEPVSAYVPNLAHRVVMDHYGRCLREEVIRATNDCSDCGDAESLRKKALAAIDSVSPPPNLGQQTAEEEAAQQLRDKNLKDIPENLLHVPGFIDKMVEYSLRSAHQPNRTISFAGALAFTAHLAGRRYTDLRGTQPNLYVFALGPSGLGKEHPRQLNRAIMREVSKTLSSTIFDTTASGEAIETTLGKRPRTLFQIDEIQKELRKMGDERNPNGNSLAQYLMKLYSASGSEYTMRPKATEQDLIGTTIYHPSLSIFATGIAKDAFRTFSPALIKEGLMGRCLMFDSAIVAEPTSFGDSAIPKLPSELVEDAKAINNAAGGNEIEDKNQCQPNVVEYELGTGVLIDKFNKEAYTKRQACEDKGDEFGAALWARASEKIGKLALIAAISENPAKPLIRQNNAQWAWELVKCLVTRMLQRIDSYMATGKAAEIGNEIMDYLSKHNGRCTQRDLLRSKKSISDTSANSDYQKALATLKNCGYIDVTSLAKGSIEIRLLKN